MDLIKWQGENYKSILEGEFDVSQSSVLIGKNNAGKSNIIDSFESIYGVITGNLSNTWLRKTATGKQSDIPVKLSLYFKLSDEEHSELIEELDSRNDIDSDILKSIKDNNWLSTVKWDLEFTSKYPDRDFYANYEGDLKSLEEIDDPLKSHSNSGYRPLEQSIQPRINDHVESWGFVNPFRKPKNNVLPGEDFTIELDKTGDNLVNVLESLDRRNEDEEIIQNISDSYVEIMEGVTDLRIEYDREPGKDPKNRYTIFVEEAGIETSFKADEISSGSKEILVLLTQIYLATRNTDLLCIEEPELHLHPGAVQKIYEIIQEVQANGGPQVLVSTHSDVFVDRSDANSIVRVQRDEYTHLQSVSEGEIGTALIDLGYEKSGLLQSEAVVFTEGRSDKRILRKFAKKVGLDFDTLGVSVVELEGIENMKTDSKSLVKLLYSFDIPYLFIRDTHGKPRVQARGELYEAMGRTDEDEERQWWVTSMDNIYVWDAYGIENYLMQPRAIAEEVTGVTEDKVQQIINESEEVEDKEDVLNKIYATQFEDGEEPENPYNKDRDGMNIAAEMHIDEIDDEVIEVLLKIGELVDGWDPSQMDYSSSIDSILTS
ncbi:ATP-dependent nuclease [Halopenitus persicus]|uniref:Predicted ATP-dependent endonuclease of the OLD family, contains P-loop ATPase and TOPRIM domains n=1 Tax=Halopenitus persicus TaxID=1048396 RepID=A0A1H3JU06_9EURY|nr:ATP-binding protein [Halopenitus persicus]SDY42985.1 Predicted ATP-dependent endonuclease of the OLD family, contains P-loop ATPase and TOPRIM domains [Halopenitus persicus]